MARNLVLRNHIRDSAYQYSCEVAYPRLWIKTNCLAEISSCGEISTRQTFRKMKIPCGNIFTYRYFLMQSIHEIKLPIEEISMVKFIVTKYSRFEIEKTEFSYGEKQNVHEVKFVRSKIYLAVQFANQNFCKTNFPQG